MPKTPFQREWLMNTKTFKGSSTSCDTKHKIKGGIGYDANGYPADIIVGFDALEDSSITGGYENQNQSAHKVKIEIKKDGQSIIDTIHAGSNTNDGWNYYYYRINNEGIYTIEIKLDSWGSCAKPDTTYSESFTYEMTEQDLTDRGELSGVDNRTEYEKHEQRKTETKTDAENMVSMIGVIVIPLTILYALIRIRKG
jgi:hypothetical protein